MATLLVGFPIGAVRSSAATVPSVSSVSPSFGPTSGGNRVTVSGSQFVGVTGVLFGASLVTKVHVVSPTQLWVTAPAAPPGVVDVEVTTTAGTSAPQPNDRYTYVTAPTITSVIPNAGPTAGGTRVDVTGTNFIGVTTVTFGNRAGTNVTLLSPSSLQVTAPPGAPGTVDIRVVTPFFTSAPAISDRYTYIAPPTIRSVLPASGPTSGGTPVTVTGANFAYVVSVTFAGVRGSIQVVTPTSLSVLAPPGTAGVVDVQVTTGYGTSALVTADHYTYVAPPTVTSVAPSNGPTTGGTTVTVTGTSFVSVTAVLFGGTPGNIVTVRPTSIDVRAPSHPAAVVDVQVVTQYGTSAPAIADRYTYVAPAPPIVTSLWPNLGWTTGGAQVTVTGSSFTSLSQVTFGGRPGSIVSATPNSIVVVAPAHRTGLVDVQVMTRYGISSPTPADGYTYLTPTPPAVTSIDPSFGPTKGGTPIQVNGTNFIGVTSVTFDGIPGTISPFHPFPTWLTVTPPPHSLGVVDVQVNTTIGASPAVTADQYTYAAGPGWGPSPVINPAGLHGHPTSVSCVSSTFCVLVDESNVATFNGTGWSTPQSIAMQGVDSVSCTSSRFCLAVSQAGQAIVFDGTSWSPQGGLQVDNQAGLDAVSCASPTFCVAVDGSGNALTFDGTNWSAPTNIDPQALTGVSCPSSSFCVAVSHDGNAITFNGTSWSTPTNLVPMGLTGISCTSSTFCVAVHATGEALVYNGTGWTPPATIDTFGGVSGVSCGSSTFCVAVDGQGNSMTFDGLSWSDPFPTDTSPFASLGGVSCPSPTFCATFGTDNGSVVTFNGTSWSAPVKVDNRNPLSAISCGSPSLCAVVDGEDNAYIWDGTGWSAPTNLNSADYYGLAAVSCVAPSFCVVSDGLGNAYTYNGAGWSPPTQVSGYAQLNGISCLSPTFCVAVDSNGNWYTFNGSGWSAPTATDATGGLSALSCVSPTFCVATDTVGDALTFDGSSWSPPTPIDVVDGISLTGLSCGSTSLCVAIDSGGNVVTFDGSTWSAPAPIDSERLSGVSCPSSSFCVAIDQSGNAFTFDGTNWSAPYPIGGAVSDAVSCSSDSFCIGVGLTDGVIWS